MIVSISSAFSDLVVIGEQIKNNMKNEKLPGATSTTNGTKKPSSNIHEKEEGETNIVVMAKRKKKA